MMHHCCCLFLGAASASFFPASRCGVIALTDIMLPIFRYQIILNSLSMQKELPSRMSFAYDSTSQEQAVRVIYELSYQKVGDQQNHLNFTHDKLVLSAKWLSESSFKQIKQLCWCLPGPTTLQVILSIVLLKTKSVKTGLHCFLIYSILPWLFYAAFTLLYAVVMRNQGVQSSSYTQLLVMGFNAASAGIMVCSFSTFFSKFLESWPKIILIVFTAALFTLRPSVFTLIFNLLLCSVLSLYLQVDQTIKPMSVRNYNLFSNLPSHFLLGRNSTLILIFGFIGLWVYFSIYPESEYSYVFGFYLIGCLLIGPMESIFAYLLVLFSSSPQFDEKYIWLGLPLVFVLPGTHTNIAIFIGGMLDGFRGAALALISLNLPCFLSIFGLLPEWPNYRDREGVRRLCQGLTCATTGLTLAMIMLTLKHAMTYDIACTLCIFVVGMGLNYIARKHTFAIVLAGGFLAYIRHFSVVCYREGTYCPFPFNF